MISESIFLQLKDHTFSLLDGLSPLLAYHSIAHTKEVIRRAEELFYAEKKEAPQDLYTLTTAALLHDTGFLKAYSGHEEQSSRIAADLLKEYQVAGKDIAAVQEMIRATRIPQAPHNHLSEILCDADLYYLGTNDFKASSALLFTEWKNVGIVQNEQEFDELQMRFFETHHYFTQSAIQLLEEKKQEHFMMIRKKDHL